MLEIDEIFSRKKGQKKVVEFLLRNGVRVSENRKLFIGDIEIPHTAISRILGVDRRLINATISSIMKNPKMKKIFGKLNLTLILRDIAPDLGFGAIEIIPTDASSKGIVAGITKIISDAGISIRQITADDPMFENAEMTIVTEKPIPRNLIDDILKIKGVKKVVVLS